MEILILVLIPVSFVMLAAGTVAAGQISGFLHFSRSRSREGRLQRMSRLLMRQMAAAQWQLAVRGRRLEILSSQLRLNNEELERLGAMKSKLFSMVVHDIRNPLTAVRGFADILRAKVPAGGQERQILVSIRRALDQIQHLIGDLTDMAMIEAGKMRLLMEPLELSHIWADVVPTTEVLAARKEIVFEADTPPDGAVLTADRFRVARVLSNFLGNAIKFTPAGGRVELRARVAGGWVTFAVKDSGPGIHPVERKKLFDKFYQSAHIEDPKSRASGWGLGLSIAAEIAHAHGGEVGVESQGLGRGASFWVRLPLAGPRVRIHEGAPGAASAGRRIPLAAVLAAALLWAAPAPAQNIPLEEKTRYEDGLERRAEEVLAKVLGPNRSKVMVEAAVDFTRIERFEAREGSGAAKEGGRAYLWSQEPPTQEEILPGVPAARPGAPAVPVKPQSYERLNTYPLDFVKRLSVTLVLDRSVTKKQSEEVRSMVSEILGIAPSRGDSLTVVHTRFTPIWKTVWYDPATAGLVIKYLLISLLSLTTLAIVAACFLKLAEAMSEMAKTQSQNLAMDMRSLGAETGPPGPDSLEAGGDGSGEAEGEGKEEPGGAGEMVFAVKPQQIEALCEMLLEERPDNVAIIASRMPPDIQRMLLEALPRGLREATLECLGRVRYVEPEVILNLKDELERRLQGAVGGLSRLVAIVEDSGMDERARLIESLAGRDPELARRVRAKVFLIEDLGGLSGDEWSILRSRVKNEEWVATLRGAPERVRAGLKASMPERAWSILEQMSAAAASDEDDRRKAQESIGRTFLALVKEGRVARPAATAGSASRLLGEPLPGAGNGGTPEAGEGGGGIAEAGENGPGAGRRP